VSYKADGLTPVIFKMVASKPSAQGFPAAWDARYEDGKPVDVQLVMCTYDKQYAADADEVSEVEGHCEGYRYLDTSGYRGAAVSVPVRAAPVTYLLYEASTKRLLTKFTLTAKDFTQADCPYLAFVDDPVVWISPKPADVAAALKPFVEASR